MRLSRLAFRRAECSVDRRLLLLRMFVKRSSPLLVALTAVALMSATAAAAPARAVGEADAYADARQLAQSIVQRGVTHAGRRVLVAQAYCSGLAQYGVRTKPYFRKEYRRFLCTLTGANKGSYRAEIVITGNTARLAWRVLSLARVN
jgi:hypothetical protein